MSFCISWNLLKLGKKSFKSCFAGGTALAGVKIPGGVLPWEIDVDFLMARSVSQRLLLIPIKNKLYLNNKL